MSQLTWLLGVSRDRAFRQEVRFFVRFIEEVVSTRAGHAPAVIVSLAEYQSLKETDYLLRNPANAKRLLESIASLEAGHGTVHELIELD